MRRRDFISTGLSGLAGLGLVSSTGSLLSACSKKNNKADLRLSFQENTAPGNSLNEKLDYMEAQGIVGLEPWGNNLAARVTELQAALRGRNISISAICAGFRGFILAEDKVVKADFDASMRDIIAAAGALGSTGVIMVPAFNGQTPCLPHNMATREYLCEQLGILGEYALECGTTIILEPLNRNEAFYLRQVGDAAAICRDAKSEGVKCMGDFWHMSEETSDYAALMAAGSKYLQHVHIASRARRLMPGEDAAVDNYTAGFRALKDLNYQHFVSFECGTAGDRAETVANAIALLREQWSKA